MSATRFAAYGTPEALEFAGTEASALANQGISAAFVELERSVYAVLETYANVHRGSGHYSRVSTHLYELARDIVLDVLELSQERYEVIFGSPRAAALLEARLKPGSYRSLSSQDTGLPLGVRAVVVDRKALPGGAPLQAGGGTARLVSPGWVLWAGAPDRFEAGTPAIVNVIAFSRALQLVQHFGAGAFRSGAAPALAAADILYHDDLECYAGRGLLEALRRTLVGRDGRVPTVHGARPFINLDNGASTPTFMPVWDAVRRAWRLSGPAQEEVVREVKAICARMLGAPEAAYEVIFTSNTTEAINLVAESLRHEVEPGSETVVLNTFLEHNSNELPWRTKPGFALIRLPVDADGFMDLPALESLLRAYNQEGQHGKQRIRLVTVSGASNVLGTFNDLAEISRIVHRYGARLLVDAAQLVAHRRVEMEAWGIDYLAFSAHKAYAPFGTGALVARKGLLSFSTTEWELIRSSGEENGGGIAALGKALVLLQRIGLDVVQEEEQALTARALRGLAQVPGLTVYGIKDPGVPAFASKGGVIIFNVKDVMPDRVAEELAARGGIGVRSGCHCAHLTIKRVLHISPLLEQFQGVVFTIAPRLSPPGVVRVSLGIENTEQDIDTLIEVLGGIARLPKAEPSGDIQQQMGDFTRAAAQRVYAPM